MIPVLLALVMPVSSPALLRLETGGHVGAIVGAASLPGGGFATTGLDKTVRLWTADGVLQKTLRYPIVGGNDGSPLTFSASGDRIALGTVLLKTQGKTTGYLFGKDADSAKEAGSADKYVATALLDDGRTVATLGSDLVLKVGNQKAQLKGQCDHALLSASPDGKRIYAVLVGVDTGTFQAFDAKTLQPAGTAATAKTYVTGIAANDAGLWIAGENYAGLWTPGSEPKPLTVDKGTWQGVAIRPEGGAVFAGAGEDGFGKAVAVSTTGEPEWSKGLGPVYATAVTNPRTGLSIVGNGAGELFRIDSGKVSQMGSPNALAIEVAWSGDGHSILWSTDIQAEARKSPQYVRAFDLGSQRPTDPVAAAEGSKLNHDLNNLTLPGGGSVDVGSFVYCAAALPDKRVVVSSADGGVQTRAADGKTNKGILDCDDALVSSLAVSPDGKYLAAAANDGIVRVFAIKDLGAATARPMLCLYVRPDDEWILWSDRECLYASSVVGDKMLNLQRTVDSGKVLFEPVSTRQDNYRRPEALRKAFAQASVAAAVSNTADADKPALTSTTSAQMELLAVRGADAKDGTYVARQPQVKVVFRVSPDVKSLRVSENVPTKDVAVASAESDGSDRRMIPVNLTSGENRIRIVGVREDGTTSEPVEVRIMLPGAGADNGTLRVLAIGVTDYPGGQVAKLPFNANDVSHVVAHFKALDGKAGKVVVTQVPEEKTTQAGILEALKSFQATIQPEDKVLLYVSSHGMQGPQGFLMLPKDVDPENPAAKGIPWKTVVEAISSKPCKASILIQDACHSGGAVAKDQVSPELSAARTDADRLGTSKNLYVFSSCRSDEVSYVDSVHEQSVFTAALIEGLKGKLNNAEPDGTVLVEDLDGPVRRRVTEIIASLVEGGSLYKVTKGGASINPPQKPHLYTPWSELPAIIVGKKES